MKNYITSRELLEKSEILYTFVDMFSAYENNPKDYGTGELYSMIEIHILNAIYNCPGITAKELSEKMRRTKGFISQVLSKLESAGHIIRIPCKTNAKLRELYVTQSGQHLCFAHNEFDEKTLLKTYQYLLRDCTDEEIEAFYRVMQVYINIMNAAAAKRKRLAQEQQAQQEQDAASTDSTRGRKDAT